MVQVFQRQAGPGAGAEDDVRVSVVVQVMAGDGPQRVFDDPLRFDGASEEDDITLFYDVPEVALDVLRQCAARRHHAVITSDGGPLRRGDGNEYLALVSRWPLRRTRVIDLAVPPGPARQGIDVQINPQGRAIRVLLGDLRWRDVLRPLTIRRLGDVIGRFNAMPTVVAGSSSFVFACRLAIRRSRGPAATMAFVMPSTTIPGHRPAVAGANIAAIGGRPDSRPIHAFGKTCATATVTT